MHFWKSFKRLNYKSYIFLYNSPSYMWKSGIYVQSRSHWERRKVNFRTQAFSDTWTLFFIFYSRIFCFLLLFFQYFLDKLARQTLNGKLLWSTDSLLFTFINIIIYWFCNYCRSILQNFTSTSAWVLMWPFMSLLKT